MTDTDIQAQINQALASGALALIPAGFRCHTKTNLEKITGFTQRTLPFDNGFFPPAAVAKILKRQKFAFQFPDPEGLTHQVCIKNEDVCRNGRLGIEFITSDYQEIMRLAQSKDQPDINRYLDATFGFYTLDKINGCVLAHYNWHPFAPTTLSQGIHDPAVNLTQCAEKLNSRLERMFRMCSAARRSLFVVGNFQGYEYMSIDQTSQDLTDLTELRHAVKSVIGPSAEVVTFSEIESPEKLLDYLETSAWTFPAKAGSGI